MIKTKPHILIVSSWYPTEENPFLGNFVQRQAQFLSSRFQVTVVNVQASISSQTFDLTHSKKANLTEITVTYPMKKSAWQRFRTKKKAYFLGFDAIQSRVDIVHGHVMLPNLPFFVSAKWHFGCPLIVTEHSSVFREGKKWLTWKQRSVLKRYLGYIDHLFAVSVFQKNDLIKLADGIPLTVLHNPIDLEFFVPSNPKPDEYFRFIHISTLDEKTKNPAGILKAIARFKQQNQEKFTFTILSDEPTEKWMAYCEKLGISDCVRFEGPSQPKEVLRQLQQSHAFVHFSNYESFSLVLAEAWACGIPVISTAVGIAAEMDENLGIQVPIGNEHAMAEAMAYMLANKVSYSPEWIRSYAIRFSVNAYLSEINRVIRSLIG